MIKKARPLSPSSCCPSLSSLKLPIYHMGPVTRAVQTGIGLAAELKAARKERKASEVSRGNGEHDVQ